MSEFSCLVVRVKIEPHPQADQIEIARVGDFQSIVKKGQFSEGDLAVYIPEQAVLPEWLLREMGFWDEAKGKGGLNGSLGNRVKAIKLRGVLSQGLVLSRDPDCDPIGESSIWITRPSGMSEEGGPQFASRAFAEGEDVAEWLGIKKYEPEVPSHLRGKIIGVDYDATHKYDFDNIKKTPTLFDEGEEVVITEKIHGTLLCVGVVPSSAANDRYYRGRVVLTSKGQGAKGIVLDHNDETNLYAQAAVKHGLLDGALRELGAVADAANRPCFVFGEVFGKTPSGKGLQDLTYSGEELAFRAFDVCVGNRGSERYMAWDDFERVVKGIGVSHVPLLYRGPFSKAVVLAHTDGNTTLTDAKQIREGVVVKSATESSNPHFGRKIAKSVSEAYLMRKNGTEFN